MRTSVEDRPMHDRSAALSRRDLPTRAIVVFLVMTFVITWGLIGAYIVFPEAATETFGEISGTHPFFFLATWAPALAAFTVVGVFSGRAGIRAFCSRLLLWRLSLGWTAFILFGLPLVYVAGSWLKGGPALAPMPEGGTGVAVTSLFVMLFLGPIEEFGWRGVAQPLLQRHMAPLWAGTLIGVTWGVWHLPAFFLAGVVFQDWSFLPFFVGNVVLAVLVTPLFNASRGSILLPMLFHWQLINPFWPDAQPYDTWILVAVCAVVVLWNRSDLFGRADAIVEVAPTEGGRPVTPARS